MDRSDARLCPDHGDTSVLRSFGHLGKTTFLETFDDSRTHTELDPVEGDEPNDVLYKETVR